MCLLHDDLYIVSRYITQTSLLIDVIFARGTAQRCKYFDKILSGDNTNSRFRYLGSLKTIQLNIDDTRKNIPYFFI